MTRSTLPIAVVLTAAFALTACGGSGTGSSDKIPGVPSAAPTTPSTPASAPVSAGVERPRITLPKDDILLFEGKQTGDPKKDAVLGDNEQFLLAQDDALVRAAAGTAALKFYAKGNAFLAAAQYAAEYKDKGLSVTGTVRYYNRRVAFLQDGSAVLAYCGDESKGFDKDRKTGKALAARPDPQDAYVGYTSKLVKDQRGIWQTTQLNSSRGDKQCVR